MELASGRVAGKVLTVSHVWRKYALLKWRDQITNSRSNYISNALPERGIFKVSRSVDCVSTECVNRFMFFSKSFYFYCVFMSLVYFCKHNSTHYFSSAIPPDLG